MSTTTMQEAAQERAKKVPPHNINDDDLLGSDNASGLLAIWRDAQDARSDNKQLIRLVTEEGRITYHVVDPDDDFGQAMIEGRHEEALEIAKTRLEKFREDFDNTDLSALSEEQLAEMKEIEVDLMFDTAYALSENGQHEEALALYEELLIHEPENAAALNNAGVALHEMGETEKAMEYYEQSIAANSNNVIARLNLAEAHWELGNTDAYYDQLIEVLKTSKLGMNAQERAILNDFKTHTGFKKVEDVEAARNGEDATLTVSTEDTPEEEAPVGP